VVARGVPPLGKQEKNPQSHSAKKTVGCNPLGKFVGRQKVFHSLAEKTPAKLHQEVIKTNLSRLNLFWGEPLRSSKKPETVNFPPIKKTEMEWRRNPKGGCPRKKVHRCP